VLSGRQPRERSDGERPQWEELSYVAVRVHGGLTGRQDNLYSSLAERGPRSLSISAPADPPWSPDSHAEPSRACPASRRPLLRGSERPATRGQPSWMTVIVSLLVTANRCPGSATATRAGPENALSQTIELSACPVSRSGHSACNSPVTASYSRGHW
jgi:hypothetical protein